MISSTDQKFKQTLEAAQRSMVVHQTQTTQTLKTLNAQKEQLLVSINQYDTLLKNSPEAKVEAIYKRIEELVTELEKTQEDLLRRLDSPDSNGDIKALVETYQRLDSSIKSAEAELKNQNNVVQRVFWMNTQLAELQKKLDKNAQLNH